MAKKPDDDLAEEQQTQEGGGGKKGGSKMLIIIIAGAVLLLGGGGFAAWKFLLAKPEAEPAAGGKKVEAKKGPTGQEAPFPLEPFVVNLADPGGNRYLKVKIVLQIESVKDQPEVEKIIPMLRDGFLLLLSSKTLAEVNSTEGKLKLRSELLNRANQVMPKGKILGIYFTEFVVQ